ncbi:hypothetical protein K435DRAFT_413254 [Dendrothele bispora CBS 962.96]|uniref:Uncharacterized protein n=1 Tax=Dendrothele bispora (strain CBS 962.96) TaxID=1314807 RepID=A0A4S8L5Z6_DENBC|nr:hypothetical protein K435DRAFT_413254 [Dendrothele bispora CBS 962.96]
MLIRVSAWQVFAYYFTEKNATQPRSSKAPWSTPSKFPPIPTTGGGATTFSCDLNPPKLQFQFGLGAGLASSRCTIRLFRHHAYDILSRQRQPRLVPQRK